MFNMIFMTITTFFTAFNRVATTADNYAKWAEEESSAFEKEARLERKAKMTALEDALGETLEDSPPLQAAA
jgi:hypothetical protein